MKIVIVAARRTAIGAFQGAFADLSAVDLGVAATRSILQGLPAADVADVIVGNVVQAGEGMNIARQISIKAGLPISVPALTINRVCGSGLQAVVTAAQGLKAGDGRLYLAGGAENMSAAPYLLPKGRTGYRYGHGEIHDAVLKDGLTDAFSNLSMGVTAENIAARYGVTRAHQDALAVESQRRAAEAIASGAFEPEIVPVEVPTRKGPVVVSKDEHPRPGTTLETLAKLRPAFQPDGGTVTAGNSSGINDGAAMLAVATEEYAKANGLPILAEILSYALAGLEPGLMGMGPAAAVPIALGRAGLSLADIDLFEFNEAFAAQAVAVIRELNVDPAKVNVRGGAIALGHPIGASGARVLVTLLHALRSLNKELGVASLCIGGGMGIALAVRVKS